MRCDVLSSATASLVGCVGSPTQKSVDSGTGVGLTGARVPLEALNPAQVFLSLGVMKVWASRAELKLRLHLVVSHRIAARAPTETAGRPNSSVLLPGLCCYA